MPASTPARVAIAVVVLVAVAAGYRWWNNPERHVRRLLSDIATTLSHEKSGTDLLTVAKVAALQNYLAPDVSIEMESAPPLRGRQEAISMAARLRASSQMMRVQFFDPEIRLSGDEAGTTRVTVQVTTTDQGGQEVASAHVVTMALVRAEGRWVVASARILPGDAAL
jgi:ketosteroid isomerase-like protein